MDNNSELYIFDKATTDSKIVFSKIFNVCFLNLEIIFEAEVNSKSFRIINLPHKVKQLTSEKKFICVDTILCSTNSSGPTSQKISACKITIDNYGSANLIFEEEILAETVVFVGPKLISFML